MEDILSRCSFMFVPVHSCSFCLRFLSSAIPLVSFSRLLGARYRFAGVIFTCLPTGSLQFHGLLLFMHRCSFCWSAPAFDAPLLRLFTCRSCSAGLPLFVFTTVLRSLGACDFAWAFLHLPALYFLFVLNLRSALFCCSFITFLDHSPVFTCRLERLVRLPLRSGYGTFLLRYVSVN